jgi:hypothetical protein
MRLFLMALSIILIGTITFFAFRGEGRIFHLDRDTRNFVLMVAAAYFVAGILTTLLILL